MAKTSATIDLKSLKEAAKTATNYLDFDETNGLRVSQSKDYTKPYVQVINGGIKISYNSNYFSNLTSSGMTIYAGDSLDPAAQFGSTATIGKDTGNNFNVHIDPSYIALRKGEENKLELSSSYLSLTDTINAAGSLRDERYFAIVSGNDDKIFDKVRVDLDIIDTPTYSSNTYSLSEWTNQASDLHFYVVFSAYLSNGTKSTVRVEFIKNTSLTLTTFDITLSYNKNTSELTISGNSSSGRYQYGGDIYYLYNTPRGSYPGYVLGYLNESYGLGKYGVHLGEWNQALGESSISEGYHTTSQGNRSHAEGSYTTAYGFASHAEGEETSANGKNSHSEGHQSIASGDYSHAEGWSTKASGADSHAQNSGTIAQGFAQTVIGTYNIAQGTSNSKVNTDHAFIIGNGESEGVRSNALTVDWNGTISYYGDVTDKALTIGTNDTSKEINIIAIYTNSNATVTAANFTKRGNLGMLHLTIRATGAVTSGSNILQIKLASKYAPVQYVSTAGYYGGRSIVGRIAAPIKNSSGQITSESVIVVRNASSTSVTLTDSVELGFTYILNNYFV